MEKRKFINICIFLMILISLLMIIFLFYNISVNITALNELRQSSGSSDLVSQLSWTLFGNISLLIFVIIACFIICYLLFAVAKTNEKIHDIVISNKTTQKNYEKLQKTKSELYNEYSEDVKYCNYCGNQIFKNETICSNCGTPVKEKISKKKKTK